MLAELCQTVRIDVRDPKGQTVSETVPSYTPPSPTRRRFVGCRSYAHTTRTPGHFPALLQAVEPGSAARIGLALHEVIVVIPAPRADEEGGGQKRSRTGAEFLDFGDRVGQGRRVGYGLVTEPVERDTSVRRSDYPRLRGTVGTVELDRSGFWVN